MAPQKERVPTSWVVDPVQGDDNEAVSARVSLRSDSPGLPFRFGFEPVRPNVFRTTFEADSHPLPPHPGVPRVQPQMDSTRPSVNSSDKSTQIQIGDIAATADWSESAPLVSVSLSGLPLHHDLPHRSYVVNETGVSHYSRYNRDTLHVGLGEKAAPMNLAGRRFEITATDSFGYDVYRTDPLYKHIPLLINATPGGCIALLSSSYSRGHYSIGAEMDGMWGHYKVYRQDYGGLEEYIIVGKTLKDIVTTYADLVGYPLLVPRWAFGYLSGGMKYSALDDPPASVALLELAAKMKEYDIPCSAYQMSSGYTVAEHPPKTRNVFTWNRHRFPDPEGFIHEYRKLGLRLIANVKPYVLANHPEYEKLKAAGAFFTDPHTGESAVTRLWSAGGGESGEGGHLDFTSAAGFKWWYDGVKKLRQEGIECIWNDNNEYTVSDDEWKCALETLPVPEQIRGRHEIGLWGRTLHTELHGKSSHDALLDVDPNTRPFVLTRSASIGTMRYACSAWSGDNITSWSGMKGANALSLNAGMSLLQCYGHDIGGFEGPQPSPELLLRWVQLGTYSPRFAINCFKTGNDNNIGDVIEPWMYPSITPLVRQAIKRRYAMIPYIYSLMLESHRSATPPQRWTGWGYESDPEVWTKEITDGETQYWFGDSLLIGGVYEPGVSQAQVYLPKASQDDDDEGFINLKAPYQYLKSGQWVTLDAEWHGAGIPVLAKVGTALPIGKDVQVLSAGENEADNFANLPLDDYRAVEIFPPQGDSHGKWYKTTWYEDDGVSTVEKNRVSQYTIEYSSSLTEVTVKFTRDESSGFVPPWQTLVVILPPGDDRSVVADSGAVTDLGRDGQARRRWELV